MPNGHIPTAAGAPAPPARSPAGAPPKMSRPPTILGLVIALAAVGVLIWLFLRFVR